MTGWLRQTRLRSALRYLPALTCALPAFAVAADGPEILFERDVQPILEAQCFTCHSHENKIKGGLALDSRTGIVAGGEGGPVIVPNKPEQSLLIKAIEHRDPDLRMPPKSKLSDAEIATLVEWVRQGAKDPRPMEEVLSQSEDADAWKELFAERLAWWSLQPISDPAPPAVTASDWPENEVDHFVLAALEEANLAPVKEAKPQVLVRRLSFALTGLPPDPATVEQFAANPTPEAYGALVQSYLDSPHFGERWARHWMDVVHYSDTHGYEWDTPAKNAWMYRDYLIRAYNNDVSYRRLVLEQIAGDLIEPRIDPQLGLNESMIGPMALRLGERRHGDNAQTEGVTQEAVANIIDTLSKGFLATTVACARCHDHKLDAVAQKDYYSLAGTIMSSRWSVRSVEATDPNGETIEELRGIKKDIREALAELWQASRESVTERIAAPTPKKSEKEEASKKADADKVTPASPTTFPASLAGIWDHVIARVEAGSSVEDAWTELASRFAEERDARVAGNAKNMKLLADFTGDEVPDGWRLDGLGMKYGLVDHGEIVVAEKGETAVSHFLPAGRWSHNWSKRLAAAARSPLFAQEPAPTISVAYAGGDYAAQSLIVDNAFHSERMKFLNQPTAGWMTFGTGDLAALAGGTDPTPRQVYVEFVSKSFNNYYPPRDNYGGLKQEVENDPRSWFGLMEAFETTPGYTPADSLGRLVHLFANEVAPASKEELATRLSALVMASVEHWRAGTCDSTDVTLLNEALKAGWLPNMSRVDPKLAALVERYREREEALQPERVVGSAEDWNEGRDAPIGVRGSYTVLGKDVPRGAISFLGGPPARDASDSSGRLELAAKLASEENPLVARVYVNRVWHYLFGAGLVRTVDDFGHLGETPSHPALLDWLSRRFIAEGWSTKDLIRRLVSSAAWRQHSIPEEANVTADPENRLWHHMPLRRLEAEAIRDSILVASGRLDATLYGEPINPYRVAEDKTKRLYAGPLDGNGRRSIYQKMTLMEPPRFLALFNQPIPKLTTGRRDATNVPNQALAMLNDPFVVAMATHWAKRVAANSDINGRAREMFVTAFGADPAPEEAARLVEFAERCATLHGVGVSDEKVWQDVAHALFNLKEFIYVE